MVIANDSNVYLPGVIQIPSSLVIIAATQAYPMVITITVNDETESNTYIAGQLVKLNIPVTYGMWQANGLTAQITAVSGNDLSLDIDSRQFDPFSIPAVGQLQPAMIAPSGSRNLQFSNDTQQIGFQSLNNRGN